MLTSRTRRATYLFPLSPSSLLCIQSVCEVLSAVIVSSQQVSFSIGTLQPQRTVSFSIPFTSHELASAYSPVVTIYSVVFNKQPVKLLSCLLAGPIVTIIALAGYKGIENRQSKITIATHNSQEHNKQKTQNTKLKKIQLNQSNRKKQNNTDWS